MANESLDFEKALENYLPTSNENGEVVKGIVIRIDVEYAYLDINTKKEGRLSLSEVENLEINDEITVQILKEDEDYIIVSYQALEKKKMLEKISVGDVLKGNIVKSTKKGYNVKIGPLSAFLPFSISGIKKGVNVNNKEVEVMVRKKEGKNILVSRTDVLDKQSKAFFDKYEVGSLIEGKITKILDFGAVVSLGTMNAFIHISELSWKNVQNITDVIKVGEKRVFKIIDINQEDKNIKLSIKQIEENPWELMKEKYKIGDVIEGKVKSIFNFGVLISLNEKEEVFMYISDITSRKVSDINAIYNIGDTVKARIISFNEEKERVQVSAKVLLEEILDDLENRYAVGEIHEGKVINVQDYGIFVEMKDKVEVFIHKNEYNWHKLDEEFNLGDTVKFKLIKVDTNEKKLSGSIRELTKSPWEEAVEIYEIGDRLQVTISDIIDAGALVPLTENFKALIPKKELSIRFIENTTDVVNIGDEVEVIVIEINAKKKSIILSIRAVQEEQEEAQDEDYE